MNPLKKTTYIVLLLIGFIHTPNVFAYLDPGTGSLLVQMLLAAIAGVMVTMNLWWHKIKSFFSSIVPKKKKEADDLADSNEE